MAITLWEVKGEELTFDELDQNFKELRDGVDSRVTGAPGNGIRLGQTGGGVGYAWHDLHSTIHTDPGSPLAPSFVAYRGGVKGRVFDEGDEAYIEFHIPHDYVPGSEVFIHAHWSHNAADVTAGTVTWGFELLYAKGHNQDAFDAPILVSVSQAASTIQYQHMVAETSITSVSGSGTTFPVASLEPDGVLMCRVYLDSNDMTGTSPLPFLHFVDLHYQSTNVGTRSKTPNFWG